MATSDDMLPILDHVAIHVVDRDAFALQLTSMLDVHVIERTDRFTLIGAHADHGKITLLDPIDERDPTPNRIVSIVLAESGGSGTPPPITMPGGLVLTFASVDDLGPAWADTPRHALVGVAIRATDPPTAAALLESGHPLRVGQVGPDHAMLEVGHGAASGRLTLSRESWSEVDRPSMLDHVGIRVPDARGWRDQVERDGLEVVKWVDADHSRAVFVSGPEGLLLEYVELTAPLEG